MAKKVLIVLANGFEDVEAITVLDVLDRAGLEVTLAGVSEKEVKSAHGAKVITDTKLGELKEEPDCLVLPGGSRGAENLSKSKGLKNLMIKMYNEGKLIASICASPAVVLAPTGILNGKKATCYPGMEKTFPKDVTFRDDPVVVDNNVITSKGPGTALLFANKLAEILAGKDTANLVKKKMLA